MKKYFSQRICVLSAFLSLAATALVSWLIMRVQYQRTPEYEEFVTGYTTWTGYFKQGDMTLANLVIAGILIFFVLFSVLLTLLSKRCSWLAGSFDRDREYKAGFHEKYEKAEFIVFLILFSEFSLAAICKMIQMAGGRNLMDRNCLSIPADPGFDRSGHSVLSVYPKWKNAYS